MKTADSFYSKYEFPLRRDRSSGVYTKDDLLEFAEALLSEKISQAEPEVSHATQLDEMKKVAEPLIKYLCENHHPRVTAIVTGTSIELLEGLMSIPKIYDYLVD